MIPNEDEALEMIVEMCHNLIVVFAEENNVNQTDLNIRIDLENLYANPIFGIFEKSRPLRRTDIKGLLKSSDLKPEMILIATEEVKNLIRLIFTNRMQFHQVDDSKEVFLILSLKEFDQVLTPAIRVFKNNQLVETEPISKIIG
jgi:hypothetical protein